ncbi:hypothetical protein AALO_G00161610 [Alosa alosa]|uniref:Uncharacterized protein n=1 Tax=Alosa alosa TaxID=278164 RepID=A0AAV6GGY4_9TELE|nr:protein crumbs homolog 2a [Alosa alosa]KAG5272096.1 hypothetical protein AALO_G00161610 [Alosa alosa]
MELSRIHSNFHKVLFITMMMFKWGTFCTATSDMCTSSPCQNGGTCVDTMDDYVCLCDTQEEVRYMGKDCDELYDACLYAPCPECESTPGTADYTCICPDGFAGTNCTEDVDECESNPCDSVRTECVDGVNGYSCYCPTGFGGEDCSLRVVDCTDEPCKNNGTCSRLPDGYECHCATGFDGDNCEEDVDECLSHPCQNGAICMDGVAEFHCFCVPGFQGYNCEIDINECASHPCENNGTCVNLKDRYICECLLGYTGMNCEVEIDECASSPCHNGATCHDLIGLYTCECVPGFEGLDCEIDIDECESDPCLNGAACIDMVNSYECDCSGTGFMGDHCEEDIPECASLPCQHGGTCEEGTNEYHCTCWEGYEGDNCEVDIDECAAGPCLNDGECFQRSDPASWEEGWEFSYAHAAGYVCQCQPGFTGENCSVDIDECESEPCQNGGTCEDLVNAYMCVCPDGFTGDSCEVNIDECESQPCQNGGSCEDGVASYTCHCPAAEAGELPWGSHDCDVQLLGCVEHECLNAAACVPWLEGDEHQHTCHCQPGFYDEVCSTPTTFSFSVPGFVLVEVLLPERERRDVGGDGGGGGPSVRLRFRTTLPDMTLFYRGDAESYLSLEIVDGGLKAKAASEEIALEAAFPGRVSDGAWRDASVVVGRGLALVLKGPGCDEDGCSTTDDGGGSPDGPFFHHPDSFTHVYIGGAPDEYHKHLEKGGAFVGCMEDLLIDSNPILPQSLPEDAMQDMELGCTKTEWCEEDPCSQRGACVDLWTSYHCDCHRPFYGNSCLDEFPSWTFSHEDTLSYVSYDVTDSHGTDFKVSFFLRSLKQDGLILQLAHPDQEDPYLSLFLRLGRVMVLSHLDASPLIAPVFLTDGEKHLVEVDLKDGMVYFEFGGLRYSLGAFPGVEVEAGDLAHVGGLPEGELEEWGGYFKGCLQDVRLDDVHLDLDAWNSSVYTTVYYPSDSGNVERDCLSDDTCKEEPCLNGGECTITWNDFVCSCPLNFTGKHCETRVWCMSDPCVNGGHCVDLPDGYECISNATFDNSPLQYTSQGSLTDPVTSVTMEVRTRTENGLLLHASNGAELLLVGLLDAALKVEIHSENSVEALEFAGQRRVSDGRWHRVQIFMTDPEQDASPWEILVDGITDGSSAPLLAGGLHFLNEAGRLVTLAESFKGCLGAVRVGGVYLPFVDDLHPPQAGRFHRVGDEAVHAGCSSAPVCDSDPCRNGGACEDLFDLFGCACAPGWEGLQCELDTDECASEPCVHGHCTDFQGRFECTCHAGYAGTTCEQDVDECEEGGCENGGTCVDGVNQYTCTCPPDYSGHHCQWNYPPLPCEELECANGGTCHDEVWGGTCTCTAAFTGYRCETEVDECASNPCLNGGSCVDRLNRFQCLCPAGFSGSHCETSKQPQRERFPWLVLIIPLVCFCVLILVIGLIFILLTARRKRQSEGAYNPSQQEVAGARLEMDSMLKLPPEERLI